MGWRWGDGLGVKIDMEGMRCNDRVWDGVWDEVWDEVWDRVWDEMG